MHPIPPIHPSIYLPHLAGIQHARQRRLLSRGDGQCPVALDLDPGAGVDAVERGQRRLPGVGALVALGLVDVVGHGPELRARHVVGELLALGCRPFVCAGLDSGFFGLVSLLLSRLLSLSFMCVIRLMPCGDEGRRGRRSLDIKMVGESEERREIGLEAFPNNNCLLN